MKKITIFTIFLIAFTLFAIPKDIKNIRKRYKEVSSVETCHTLDTKVILAAVGPQNTKIKYCFTSYQKDPENDPYLMGFNLVKVSIDYNIAASMEGHKEYIFDKKGKLIFMFSQLKAREMEGDVPPAIKTERYYFKSDKLIRTVIKGMKKGDKSVTKDKKFSKKEIKKGKDILKKGEYHLKFFVDMTKIEKMDKD